MLVKPHRFLVVNAREFLLALPRRDVPSQQRHTSIERVYRLVDIKRVQRVGVALFEYQQLNQ